jgi:putative tributyrin esterase
MALIHCNFSSSVLLLDTSMSVILPEPGTGRGGSVSAQNPIRYPTLYLLHGLSDDHTAWQRRTAIERYTASLHLAVVMPEVHRSFYTDMVHGNRYWTFISEELPAIARSFFPLSDRREDNFVTGLSMGGYGAFKLALTYPERYMAAASLSGALDIAQIPRHIDGAEWVDECKNIFGESSAEAGDPNDLFFLAERLAESGRVRPMLYQWCGTEDFLYEDNLRFRDHAKTMGLELHYEEAPGTHEWVYWDQQIQKVLAWLPLQNNIR